MMQQPVLTPEQRAEVRARLKAYRENAPKIIADDMGVSVALIYQIANGREFADERTATVPRGTTNYPENRA